jgi:hypothetical protein
MKFDGITLSADSESKKHSFEKKLLRRKGISEMRLQFKTRGHELQHTVLYRQNFCFHWSFALGLGRAWTHVGAGLCFGQSLLGHIF